VVQSLELLLGSFAVFGGWLCVLTVHHQLESLHQDLDEGVADRASWTAQPWSLPTGLDLPSLGLSTWAGGVDASGSVGVSADGVRVGLQIEGSGSLSGMAQDGLELQMAANLVELAW